MAMAFVRTLVRSTFPPPYTRGLLVILGAEEKLMAKLLEEKDARIMEKDTLLEMMAEEAAHTLSRYTAVLSNRVIIDTGLKSAFPDAKTFTLRYEQFLKTAVLQNNRLSPAADCVRDQLPRELGVNEVDLRKELLAFPHNVSKCYLKFSSGWIHLMLYMGALLGNGPTFGGVDLVRCE